MQLASLALAAVMVAGLLVWLVWRAVTSARSALVAAENAERRYRIWTAERAQFVKVRTSIADAATSTTDAVQLGSTVAQTGHRAIAAIPFGIFGALPATRPGSERVRDIHDGTSDAVYDSIASISEGISEAIRKRMTGELERRQRRGPTQPDPAADPSEE